MRFCSEEKYLMANWFDDCVSVSKKKMFECSYHSKSEAATPNVTEPWGTEALMWWSAEDANVAEKKNINKYKSSQRDRNPFETWKPILAQVPDCPNPYNQSTIYNLPSTIYKHTLHYRKGICQFESCVKILERNKTCHKQFCMTPCVGFVLHAVVLCLCRNVSCMQ